MPGREPERYKWLIEDRENSGQILERQFTAFKHIQDQANRLIRIMIASISIIILAISTGVFSGWFNSIVNLETESMIVSVAEQAGINTGLLSLGVICGMISATTFLFASTVIFLYGITNLLSVAVYDNIPTVSKSHSYIFIRSKNGLKSLNKSNESYGALMTERIEENKKNILVMNRRYNVSINSIATSLTLLSFAAFAIYFLFTVQFLFYYSLLTIIVLIFSYAFYKKISSLLGGDEVDEPNFGFGEGDYNKLKYKHAPLGGFRVMFWIAIGFSILMGHLSLLVSLEYIFHSVTNGLL